MITWPFPKAASQVANPAQSATDDLQGAYSTDLNRVLTAAVVNRRFCNLLLTDPQTALHSGYNGESFQLSDSERHAVLAIRASNLRDFASQLVSNVMDEGRNDLAGYVPHHARRTEAASVAQYA